MFMQKRKVCQYDSKSLAPIRTYDSIHEAQEAYHVSHISEVCHGRRKTDGGFIWKYADTETGGRTYAKRFKKISSKSHV